MICDPRYDLPILKHGAIWVFTRKDRAYQPEHYLPFEPDNFLFCDDVLCSVRSSESLAASMACTHYMQVTSPHPVNTFPLGKEG